MVNRPRIKGTAAETAFVHWMHIHGEQQVERHALHGDHDLGDINGVPGLVISVKYVGKGKPMDLSGWVNELQTMRTNVRGRYTQLELPDGVLVVRRPGYPDVGDWYVVQRWGDFWRSYSEAFLT